MNWRHQKQREKNLNYSNALYIPPSRYGTYVVADHLNDTFRIFTNNSSYKSINKFDINSTMKPFNMKNYLNYNDDTQLVYGNRIIMPLKRDDNQLARNLKLNKKSTNLEPFTRYDSKRINTFNRLIYLPAPKTTPDDIIVRQTPPKPMRNLNQYSKRSIDSDSTSSSVSNDHLDEDNLSESRKELSLDESDMNTLNVNEEINLENEISSTSSDYEFLNDNTVRSYKPYKQNKKSNQPITDFSTEFIFKEKNFNDNNSISFYKLNQENSSILKHISELAKQRAVAFSKKNNLYRFF